MKSGDCEIVPVRLVAGLAKLDDVEPLIGSVSSDERWKAIVRHEFQTLWQAGGLFGVTLVDPDTGEQFAWTLGGFVTPPFSERLLTMKRRYVGEEATAWINSGRGVLHPSLDIDPLPAAAEGARAGLHLHLFAFHWVGPSEAESTIRVRGRLGRALTELTEGAQLRCISLSAYLHYKEVAYSSGFRVLNDNGGDFPMTLMGADRTIASQSSVVSLMTVFGVQPPRLRLSHKQRRLLFYHRLGLSEDEIADRIFVSVKSMKTYWDRIYSALEEIEPSPSDRGQKRRWLERYIAEHPEEVWPFRPDRQG